MNFFVISHLDKLVQYCLFQMRDSFVLSEAFDHIFVKLSVVYKNMVLSKLFEPNMLQSLHASQALLRIDDQKLLDQVLALIWNVFKFFVSEVEISLFYFFKYLLRIFSLKGKVPRHKCVQENTDRPNISLHVVVFFQHLWCHVIGSPCNLLGC